MTALAPQFELTSHYEDCFRRHGRTPQGVDWPNAADLATRFETMLGVTGGSKGSILDLGCGPGLLLDHLESTGRLGGFDYSGIDLSEPMLEAARQRWPGHSFTRQDILEQPLTEDQADYVLMNGLLTERRGIGEDRMRSYALDLLEAAFRGARRGIAFNVMSKLVDWERDDLFHWGFDDMAQAVSTRLSRRLVIRADYGLYEYTVYVYRQPRRG